MANKEEIKFEKPSSALMLVNQYLWVLLLSILLVILLIGYFFILSPKIDQISQSREDTNIVVEKQAEVDSLIQKVTDLNEKYSALEKRRANDLIKLKKILPEDPQIAELFVIAERLANRRGFSLSAIDIADSTQNSVNQTEFPEGLHAMAISLAVSREITEDNPLADDPYDAFKVFLDDLERNLRLFDVQTVSFSGIGEPNATSLSFNFTLTTYFAPEGIVESGTGLKKIENNLPS